VFANVHSGSALLLKRTDWRAEVAFWIKNWQHVLISSFRPTAL